MPNQPSIPSQYHPKTPVDAAKDVVKSISGQRDQGSASDKSGMDSQKMKE